MGISACPNCGSTKLKMISGGTDAIFDVLGASSIQAMRCAECGKSVLPIEFGSEAERKKFVKSLKETPEEPEGPQQEAREQPTDAVEGVTFERGYAAWVALGCGLVSITTLLVTMRSSGFLPCGIPLAATLAALAVFFYTRSRKRVLKQEARK